MIDIHTHILPLVDDGAKSFETAIQMIEKEINDGVKTIFLTPHYVKNTDFDIDLEIINKTFEELKEKVKELELDIELILGREVYFRDNLEYDLYTLNNSKYILVEFPMKSYFDIEEAVYNLKVSGYKPIIAHIERYDYIKCVEDVKKIKDLGALIQVNSLSILGGYGRKIKKLVMKMMKNDLVNFVASDSHNDTKRVPNLKETYNFVCKKFGEEYANKIFITNQQKLVDRIK